MADQESFIRLTEDDYGPRSSSYLREGYKDDNFELTNVMVGETRAIGSVKVNNFFPADGWRVPPVGNHGR